MVSSYRESALHIGIVLQSMQYSEDRVVVLDRDLGKIQCIFPDKKLHHGSYIEYTPRSKKRYYIAYQCNILGMPLGLSPQEIVFLHHILEVGIYFLPEGFQSSDIFDHVRYGLQRYSELSSSYAKKIYLAKLLVLLGVYVEHAQFEESDWQLLINESIDVILIKLQRDNIEQLLTEWLHMCITAHPHARYLKTRNVMKEM